MDVVPWILSSFEPANRCAAFCAGWKSERGEGDGWQVGRRWA